VGEEEMIDDDEDLREYVERLETLGEDAFGIDNPNQLEFDFVDSDEDDDDNQENVQSIADEVEQFLRDQDGR
jgi:hypothetical protein